MKPQTIGRVLGIGVRLAGRVAGAGAQVAASAVAPPSGQSPSLAAGRTAGQVTRGAARGLRGFLRPFSRVGGILWLEVSGVFFLLPVLVLAPEVWRTRLSYAQGLGHRNFLISATVSALFLYLSVSSFWRARKR
jgi:hypothetical protein